MEHGDGDSGDCDDDCCTNSELKVVEGMLVDVVKFFDNLQGIFTQDDNIVHRGFSLCGK